MAAPGVVHLVGAPGQTGVTSVVTWVDHPPKACGCPHPGVCATKFTLVPIEVGPGTVPICSQEYTNRAAVETLVHQVHTHQVGGLCLLRRHKCAGYERETSDEKY
jgi:hypothetical protein